MRSPAGTQSPVGRAAPRVVGLGIAALSLALGGCAAPIGDVADTRAAPAPHTAGQTVVSISAVRGTASQEVRLAVLVTVQRLAPLVARSWDRALLPVTLRVERELPGHPAWAALTYPGDPPTVLVSQTAWEQLSPSGRDVVIAHELAHAAARTWAPGVVPPWLEEGLAEWTAQQLYAESGRAAPATPASAPATQAVPVADDFTSPDAGQQYALAAGMVSILVQRIGVAGVHQLYRQVGAAGAPDVDEILLARASLDVAGLANAAAGAAAAAEPAGRPGGRP